MVDNSVLRGRCRLKFTVSSLEMILPVDPTCKEELSLAGQYRTHEIH